MPLNNKNILLAFTPFVIFAAVFFNTSIFAPLLDGYIEKCTKSVNSKDFSYKKAYDYIDRNKDNFAAVTSRTEEDKIVLWKSAVSIFVPQENPNKATVNEIGDTVKIPPLPPLLVGSLNTDDGSIQAEVKNQDIYRVQMTIPEDGMAIINDQIYYIGDENNGIILTRVDRKQACIKTQKGQQCIKIF